MFSLQKLLGKEDKFFDLLEASAEEARSSVQALVRIVKSATAPPTLEDFVLSRRKEKRIAQEISEELVNTFITGLERKLMLELLGDLYSGRHETLKVVVLKDLYELLERIIDRCRDAGNVINHIVLKNS